MKLYTEEQVRKALETWLDQSIIHTQDDVIRSLTPIELPTDEEIGKGCDDNIPLDEQDMWSERLYFRIGAKWAIEQIKKQ